MYTDYNTLIHARPAMRYDALPSAIFPRLAFELIAVEFWGCLYNICVSHSGCVEKCGLVKAQAKSGLVSTRLVVVVSAMVFACMLCVYSSPNSLNSLICGVSECPGLRVTLEHIVKER